MSDEEKIYTRDKMKQKTVYPTEQTPSYADWALYEMGKDLEDKVDEQSGGAEYTAGSGISISEENVISNTAQPDVTKSYVDNADLGLQQQIDAVVASSDVKDIVGTYADLQAYDTTTLGNNDIIKVLTDSTHNNATGYYRWVITQDVGAWTYIGSEGPYYTKSEADTLLLDKLNKNFNNADVGQATAGQVLKVNSSANGVEFGDVPTELPAISSGDAGKVLTVNLGETGIEWKELSKNKHFLEITPSYSKLDGNNITANQFKQLIINDEKEYIGTYIHYEHTSNPGGYRFFDGIILGFTGNNIGSTYYTIKIYGQTGKFGVIFNDSLVILNSDSKIPVYQNYYSNLSTLMKSMYGSDGTPIDTHKIPEYRKTGSSDNQHNIYWIDTPTGTPAISSGDAGKVLTVNAGETAAEWSTPAGGLPASTSSDEGKVLTVDSQGDAAWDDVPKELPAITSGDAGKVLAVNAGETGYELINKLDGFTIERYGESNCSGGNGSNTTVSITFGGNLNCNEKDYIVIIFQEKDYSNNAGSWIIEGKIFTGNTGNVNSLNVKATGYNNPNSTIYYKYLVLSKNKKESTSTIYVIGTVSTGILQMFTGGSKGQVFTKKNNTTFNCEWTDISLSNSSNPTTSTVGYVGQIYINTTTQDAFICTAADTVTPAYTWKKITLA